MEGFSPEHLEPAPDQVVVGNTASRGNPAVEHMLARGMRYISGPQWRRTMLQNVGCWRSLARTTRPAPPACWPGCWSTRGLNPGFLIGGVPQLRRLGAWGIAVLRRRGRRVRYGVLRQAFRSSCITGLRTLVMNNLEFDHADIFDDTEAIQRQFHHLVRTVPGNGLTHHTVRGRQSAMSWRWGAGRRWNTSTPGWKPIGMQPT